MIAAGKVSAQINRAGKLLKQLGLLEERHEWVKYSNNLPGQVRSLSYFEEYQFYVNNKLFDFRLVDQALFQFKLDFGEDVSYCYYQAPFDVPSYEDYLIDLFGSELINLDEIGDSFREDYGQLLETEKLRNSVTPIRYDYNPRLYETGVHPAAHVHIGLGNDVRLYTRRLMLPLSFFLFVLRQMYPNSWRKLLQRNDCHKICRAVREDLALIDEAFDGAHDKWQLILD